MSDKSTQLEPSLAAKRLLSLLAEGRRGLMESVAAVRLLPGVRTAISSLECVTSATGTYSPTLDYWIEVVPVAGERFIWGLTLQWLPQWSVELYLGRTRSDGNGQDTLYDRSSPDFETIEEFSSVLASHFDDLATRVVRFDYEKASSLD